MIMHKINNKFCREECYQQNQGTAMGSQVSVTGKLGDGGCEATCSINLQRQVPIVLEEIFQQIRRNLLA